ncbi:MAG: serpin family protein [Pirellulales bacterium]|nr:serpin family protein [Pirellulales bacterium]
MNPIRIVPFAAVLAASGVFCSLLWGAEPEKGAVDNAVAANGDFALDLYKQLSNERRSENLFFSPYSIFSALSMTAEGARGETAEQMCKTLRFPGGNERIAAIHAGLAELNRRYNAPDLPYELQVANALWGEKSHPFLRSYIDAIEKHYKTGGLFSVDFCRAPEAARLRINDWVEDKTNDKIKDLIAEGQIDSSTRLVLTNAIYFKGDWRDTFDPINTRPRDFSVSAEKKVRVPTMFQEESHLYWEDESLQVLELPYRGRDVSMLIALPRKVDGLPALEQSLSRERIGKWRARLRPRRVEVHLPKFKLETAFELKPTLERLGMKRAFAAAADFSGIDGERYLMLSAVIHKTFADVNEAGTVAAAATAVTGLATGMPPRTTPAVFRADHPFLFMICDKQSGNILFLGRVIKPEKGAATGSSLNSPSRFPG